MKAKFMPKYYQLKLFKQLQNLRKKGMLVTLIQTRING